MREEVGSHCRKNVPVSTGNSMRPDPSGSARHDARGSALIADLDLRQATDRPSGDQTGCRTSTSSPPGRSRSGVARPIRRRRPSRRCRPPSARAVVRHAALRRGRGLAEGDPAPRRRSVRCARSRTQDGRGRPSAERATHPHGTKGTAGGFARRSSGTSCDTRAVPSDLTLRYLRALADLPHERPDALAELEACFRDAETPRVARRTDVGPRAHDDPRLRPRTRSRSGSPASGCRGRARRSTRRRRRVATCSRPASARSRGRSGPATTSTGRSATGRYATFPFTTWDGPSAFTPGGADVLKIDYEHPQSPWLIRDILDELVQIDDELFLGQALLRLRGGSTAPRGSSCVARAGARIASAR